MDDDESPHDNGMQMLHAFLTYAENGVPPAEYILEHFAICFRKILKEGTYTFDESALEHPQFAHKLGTKAMGQLVREALYIAKPYTTEKEWNDAEWFYDLDVEVTSRRLKRETEKAIFADITIRQFESEGHELPTDADHANLRERYRRLQNKFGSREESRIELARLGVFENIDSRKSDQLDLSKHKTKNRKT